MFGLSIEHLLVLGIVVLLFGSRRLPELGNAMGKAIRNFKDALSGVEEAKYREIDEKAQPPVAHSTHATPGEMRDTVKTTSADPKRSNSDQS